MDYKHFLAAMQTKYRELTGFSPDAASDVGIRFKVLAGELGSLWAEMAELRGQIFPQTATGESLDLHAATRAVSRKPALRAAGRLRFSREIPAAFDISLPKGILCSTKADPQIHFETAQDAVLAAGATSVDIPAEAAEAGGGGNVAASAVCLLVTGALGISSVTNPAAFTGGADEENDGALRARLLSSYANISNTTNAAFYYDAAMSHEDVVSANVLPRKRGRGTVDVVIACRAAQEEAAAALSVQRKLALEKEINVDVSVYACTRSAVAVSAKIAIAADADFALTAAACRSRIAAFIGALGVGRPLYCAALTRELLAVEGVTNCKLVSPAADVSPAQAVLLTAGTLTVERMDA